MSDYISEAVESVVSEVESAPVEPVEEPAPVEPVEEPAPVEPVEEPAPVEEPDPVEEPVSTQEVVQNVQEILTVEPAESSDSARLEERVKVLEERLESLVQVLIKYDSTLKRFMTGRV